MVDPLFNLLSSALEAALNDALFLPFTASLR